MRETHSGMNHNVKVLHTHSKRVGVCPKRARGQASCLQTDEILDFPDPTDELLSVSLLHQSPRERERREREREREREGRQKEGGGEWRGREA